LLHLTLLPISFVAVLIHKVNYKLFSLNNSIAYNTKLTIHGTDVNYSKNEI